MIALHTAQNAHAERVGAAGRPELTGEQDLAIHLLCSRLLGDPVGRPMLYHLARSTIAQFRPPPPLPGAARVLRRLKLTDKAVDRLWAIAEATTGLLERALLNEFIPEELVWPDLWRLVAAGPSKWGHRVD